MIFRDSQVTSWHKKHLGLVNFCAEWLAGASHRLGASGEAHRQRSHSDKIFHKINAKTPHSSRPLHCAARISFWQASRWCFRIFNCCSLHAVDISHICHGVIAGNKLKYFCLLAPKPWNQQHCPETWKTFDSATLELRRPSGMGLDDGLLVCTLLLLI